MRKRTAERLELAVKEQKGKCAVPNCPTIAGTRLYPDFKFDTKPRIWRGAVCLDHLNLIAALDHDPDGIKNVEEYRKQGGFKITKRTSKAKS